MLSAPPTSSAVSPDNGVSVATRQRSSTSGLHRPFSRVLTKRGETRPRLGLWSGERGVGSGPIRPTWGGEERGRLPTHHSLVLMLHQPDKHRRQQCEHICLQSSDENLEHHDTQDQRCHTNTDRPIPECQMPKQKDDPHH